MAAQKKKALIIVESPSKAKKIGTYVERGTLVMASVGHIRDLPLFTLGVSVANRSFEPKYQIPDDKKKIVEDLRKATAKVSTVYLASDPDREGESIAWHLYEVLKDIPGERTFYRVRYNEVTKSAVLAALAAPTEIDRNLVDAQQARRIEDRLSGFKISKLISSTVRGARSAGRVQSVALRLIVDRERDIREFRTTPYWLIGAELGTDGSTFPARLAAVDGKAPKFMAYGKEVAGVSPKETADAYMADLKPHTEVRVTEVRTSTESKRPQPPFITSTLQQAASTQLGFSPDHTMRIAQALYEEGYITYMRTDGFTVSTTIRESVNRQIAALYGPECVPEKPNIYGKKVKNAQEAHEPIRPTDITRLHLDGADPMQARLYDLIWRRFVASQMASARFERTTVSFEPTVPPPTQHAYRFSASAQKNIFMGYLRVWQDVRSGQDETDAASLPQLAKGDVLRAVWTCEAKETQPPPRYNEASLVRAMEEEGIGRPSTYAATVRTLIARTYVESGKGHVLTPTDIGIRVIERLLSEMPDFINVKFTAKMESALDLVAEGSLNWVSEVDSFYTELMKWLAADSDSARKILGQLEQVQEWNPPSERKGKVVWDDRAFVEDMTKALDSGELLTKSQLATLTKMAITYRRQLPGLSAVIPDLPPPTDKACVEALFAALEGRDLTEWEKKFTESVRTQFGRKGDLSVKQLAMLRRIAHPEEDTDHPDNEAAAGELLAALGTVKEWNEPVTRGKRTYDDSEFAESLNRQLSSRHFLTERQFEALKRTVRAYSAQIENYADLAEKYAIKAPARRAAAKKTGTGKSTAQKGTSKTGTSKTGAKKTAAKKSSAKKSAAAGEA